MSVGNLLLGSLGGNVTDGSGGSGTGSILGSGGGAGATWSVCRLDAGESSSDGGATPIGGRCVCLNALGCGSGTVRAGIDIGAPPELVTAPTPELVTAGAGLTPTDGFVAVRGAVLVSGFVGSGGGIDFVRTGSGGGVLLVGSGGGLVGGFVAAAGVGGFADGVGASAGLGAAAFGGGSTCVTEGLGVGTIVAWTCVGVVMRTCGCVVVVPTGTYLGGGGGSAGPEGTGADLPSKASCAAVTNEGGGGTSPFGGGVSTRESSGTSCAGFHSRHPRVHTGALAGMRPDAIAARSSSSRTSRC
jgi:hypothetical protein